jgi:hypothetical protein
MNLDRLRGQADQAVRHPHLNVLFPPAVVLALLDVAEAASALAEPDRWSHVELLNALDRLREVAG